MGRPQKQKIDYFPHDTDATNRKTLFILESQFGNDGYAFWFKLLELLGSSDGHFIDCGNSSTWEFLLARMRVSRETAREILNLLAKLGAIDSELWKDSIIWSQNFVNRIAVVYKHRQQNIPQKPSTEFLQQKSHINGVSDSESTQSKVKKRKENIYPSQDISTGVNSLVVDEPETPLPLGERIDKVFDSLRKGIKSFEPMPSQGNEKEALQTLREIKIKNERQADSQKNIELLKFFNNGANILTHPPNDRQQELYDKLHTGVYWKSLKDIYDKYDNLKNLGKEPPMIALEIMDRCLKDTTHNNEAYITSILGKRYHTIPRMRIIDRALSKLKKMNHFSDFEDKEIFVIGAARVALWSLVEELIDNTEDAIFEEARPP